MSQWFWLRLEDVLCGGSLTTRRLIVCITFLAIFAMAARIAMDPDTWWHLRTGRWILDHHAVPRLDPFSYTRYGQPWYYPSSGWLVEAPMVWVYRALGPAGLNLWTASMVALTFGFIWPALTGGPFTRAFALVFAAVVSAVYWAARPYLVTFLFSAVFLWVLEDERWGRANRLWLLPALMVVWANSHGGFVMGFLIWGVYLAGRVEKLKVGKACPEQREGFQVAELLTFLKSLRAMIIVGLLMALAACLNPSGPVMMLYAFKTLSIGALRDDIQEWQSPDFHMLNVQPFAWMLLALLGALGLSRKRLALTDFLLVAGFGYLALMAGRNVAQFALVAPIVLTRHIEPVLRAGARFIGLRASLHLNDTPRNLRLLNGVLLGLIAVAVVVKISLIVPSDVNSDAFRKFLPVGAVEYLKETRPPGRLLSSYNWGGYLLWALPEYPVFVDGRTDLYDDEIIEQWITVIRAEDGWQEVLDRWEVRVILLEPDRAVVGQLAWNGWTLLYRDDTSVIYRR